MIQTARPVPADPFPVATAADPAPQSADPATELAAELADVRAQIAILRAREALLARAGEPGLPRIRPGWPIRRCDAAARHQRTP